MTARGKRTWTQPMVAGVQKYLSKHGYKATLEHFRISSAQVYHWRKNGWMPMRGRRKQSQLDVLTAGPAGVGKSAIVARVMAENGAARVASRPQLILAHKLKRMVVQNIAKTESVTAQDLLTLQLIDSLTGE